MQFTDRILTFMMYLYNDNGYSLIYKDFETLTEFFKYIYTSFVADIVTLDDMNSLKYAILIEPKSA